MLWCGLVHSLEKAPSSADALLCDTITIAGAELSPELSSYSFGDTLDMLNKGFLSTSKIRFKTIK